VLKINIDNMLNIKEGGEKVAKDTEKLPTIYVRDVPEDLYFRVKVQTLREKTTLRELVFKALYEYLDRHEKKGR